MPWAAIGLACCLTMSPRAVGAQELSTDVLVLVDEGPLREPFAVELGSRGLRPRFQAPVAAPVERAHALGAAAVLWLADGAVHVWTARAASVARLPTGEADATTIALLGAALLEERLAVPVPEPPPVPVRPRYRVPALGLYTGAEVGGYVRFLPRVEGMASFRSSLGLQWREGLRVGVVWTIDGYHERHALSTQSGPSLTAGLELGARLGDDLVAFHFGAHALLGPGRPHLEVAQGPPVVAVAGASVGIGVFVDPRVELGVRVQGEVWEEPGYATSPALRATARVEWR